MFKIEIVIYKVISQISDIRDNELTINFYTPVNP